MKKTYVVGQVLFFVPEKSTRIIPTQVVEEIIKTSLHGSEVTYLMKVNSTNEFVELSSFQGDLYENIETIKNILNEKAKNAIEQSINKALEQSKLLFPSGILGDSEDRS